MHYITHAVSAEFRWCTNTWVIYNFILFKNEEYLALSLRVTEFVIASETCIKYLGDLD